MAEPSETLQRIHRFLGIKEKEVLEPVLRNVASQRMAAPLLLRKFARFQSLQPWVRSVSRKLSHSAFGSMALKQSDKTPFVLSDSLFEEVFTILEHDLSKLEELLNEDFSDWNLKSFGQEG